MWELDIKLIFEMGREKERVCEAPHCEGSSCRWNTD
jgi:hypothetical protein